MAALLETMKTLWTRHLCLEKENYLEPTDDFWELGGDSNAAMKLSSSLRAEGFELPVIEIFRHPTLETMAAAALQLVAEPGLDLLDSIPTTDTTLVSRLCGQLGLDSREIESCFPCTPTQEGLLALASQRPGSYMAQQTFMLPQTIDLERFKAAIREVTQSLPILRTRIVQDDSMNSWQVVLKQEFIWHLASSLVDYLATDFDASMDYGTSLSRFGLISEPRRPEVHFVWTLHHALFDRWSLSKMLHAAAQNYEGKPKPKQSIGMWHFVQFLNSASVSTQEQYWREILDGAEPPRFPKIPICSRTDEPHAQYDFGFSVSLKSKSGNTLSTTLRGVWALLLAQYSGTHDVVYGLTVSGRESGMSGIEHVAGPTISTVPLRVRINPDNTVLEFLSSLQTQTSEMIPHEHFGLQRIRRISPEVRAATAFQTLLVIQPPTESDSYASIFGNPSKYDTSRFHTYPLVVECFMSTDGITLHFEFNPATISRSQIELIANQFAHLCKQILHGDSGAQLGYLQLASPLDMQFISSWNKQAPQEIRRCVHDLIPSRTSCHADRQAVAAHDGSLTYAQLDRLSTALACRLQAAGVGLEASVAVCFEKSYRMIIAMVAIMKAGACFVPIDAEHPTVRRAEIVHEADIKYALTSTLTATSCKGLVSEIMVFDDLLEDDLASSAGTLNNVAQPDNALYILYTSGSTGKPKGVLIEHKAFCSAALSRAHALQRDSSTRILQYSNFVFDTSMEDIITTLLTGGTICIPSDEDRLADLASAMERLFVNYAHLTPTVVKSLAPADVPSLRTLCLGGERILPDNVRIWAPAVDLLLTYGPSEGCVTQTVTHKADNNMDPANLGFGYGARFWIVDPLNHHRLTPVGAVGELLLEGPLLAREYVKNPEKTAMGFVTGLHFANPESRFYKTGDLVHYALDGSFRFVARKDNQVKHHGQRVELGEIEHHVSMDPRIQHAVACLPTMGPCSQKLVIVLSMHDAVGHAQTFRELKILSEEERALLGPMLAEIRQNLTSQLPSYMVPSVWITAHGIPMTSSGKIDRNSTLRFLASLSAVHYQRAVLACAGDLRMDPNTTRECVVRDACASVLNLPQEAIGMEQNFVGLGGDSISAMQVVARCRTQGLFLKVKALIRARSLRNAASSISDQPHSHSPNISLIPATIPITPIQQVFFDNDGPEADYYNQSFLLQILGQRITVGMLRKTMSHLMNKHPMLRARYVNSKGVGWTASVSARPSRPVVFETGDSRPMAEIYEEIAELQKLINMRSGPVIIGAMFQCHGIGQILCLISHHLVVDYMSWRIILEDAEAYLRGTPLHTQEGPSFACSASALMLETAKVRPQDSWRAIDEKDSINCAHWKVPMDQNTFADVVRQSCLLDKSTTASLLHPPASMDWEPLDLFLSAVVLSFASTFPERNPPVVFNEIHGRQPLGSGLDLSTVVGWFTSLTPLDVPICPGVGIAEVASSIHRARSADATEGLGYLQHYSKRNNDVGKKSFCAELIVNYAGMYQQLERRDAYFRALPKAYSDAGLNMKRSSLLEISIEVREGELCLDLYHNRHMAGHERFGHWLESCSTMLSHFVSSKEASNEALPVLARFREKQSPYPDFQIDDSYPCTPLQLGMLMSLAKNPLDYNDVIIARVHADSAKFDTNLIGTHMEHAWKVVVAKHPALRTIFLPGSENGDLFEQVVLQDAVVSVAVLAPMDEPECHKHLKRQLAAPYETSAIQHKLTVAPTLCGKVLFRLDICHTVFDGFSLNNVLLPDLCSAIRSSMLPSKELEAWTPRKAETITHGFSLGAYARYLSRNDRSDERKYWARYLSNCVPTMITMGEDQGPRELASLQVNMTHVEEMLAISRFHGVTVANFAMAAWAIMLRCFCDSEDVVFGYLSSGRDSDFPGVISIVGPLANVLPCRVQLDDSISVLDFLRAVQDDYFESQGREHVSLSEMLYKSGSGQRVLFNTLVSVQAAAPLAVAGPIECRVVENIDPTEFDLALDVVTSPKEVKFKLEYWKSSFSSEQATILADTLSAILGFLSLQPAAALSNVQLAGKVSTQKFKDWNCQLLSTEDRCLHEVFEEQASSAPSSQAVTSWDGDLTYEALDSLANQVAQRLREFGVGSATVLVPILMQKSLMVPVAMLAVLKAGGAIVALDPNHPEARLKDILAQLNASIGIVDDSSKSIIQGAVDYTMLLDTNTSDGFPVIATPTMHNVRPEPYLRTRGAIGTTNVPSSFNHTCESNCDGKSARQNMLRGDSLAYVCFTSGSTGRPKGVMVQHGAFCASALSRAKAIRRGPSSRVLQFTSLMFDASLEDIITTLITGGCVCLPSDFERWNDIPSAVRRMNVNCADITPSLAASLNPNSLTSISTLIVGGELLHRTLLKTWADHTDLLITYGPTEASCVTTVSLPKTSDGDPANVGPAVGAHAWIVDADNVHRLVPAGAVGELLLEGPLLALGYLGNETATKQAFISDLAWTREDKSGKHRRFYRTGDLARHNTDGSLQFIGRRDNQLKINGQRVELDEIQAHFSEALPGLPAVVMAVRFEPEKPVKIAAFFCSGNETAGDSLLDTSKMEDAQFQMMICRAERYLSKHLPTYMVPAAFIPVTNLPLTTTGKLDRQLLLGQVLSTNFTSWSSWWARSDNTSRIEPVTPTQTQLRDLWAVELRMQASAISVSDSWFRLGGDSITAIRLVRRARERGLGLTVDNVFRHPVLSEMASSVSTTAQVETTTLPFALLPDEIQLAQVREHLAADAKKLQDAYPCTPMQEGMFAQSLRNSQAYVSHRTFILAPHIDIQHFRRAWEVIYHECEILRTRIYNVDGVCLQAVLDSRLEWVYGQQDDDFAEFCAKIGFGSPLCSFAIRERPCSNEYQFSLVMHHALYDADSIANLLRRAKALYDSSEPSGLASNAPPYRNYVKYVVEDTWQSSMDYWALQLGSEDFQQFPTLPHASYTASPSRTIKHCPAAGFEGRAAAYPPSVLAQAAWAVTIANFTHSQTATFGVTNSGRSAPLAGVDQICGPTLVTVPAHVRLDPNSSTENFLSRVQHLIAERIPHEHFGMQNMAKLHSAAAKACQFQSLLVVQSANDDLATWDGVEELLAEANVSSFNSYALMLTCVAAGSAFNITANFDPNVVTEAQTERLLVYFSNAVMELQDMSSGHLLKHLLPLSGTDAAKITSWHQHLPQESAQLLHNSFAVQAQRRPKKIAVHAWDGSFSYVSLSHLSSCCAAVLIRDGVQPGERVALCFRKSKWAVVAMLGILKAGCTMIPLDPSHPACRLKQILSLSNAARVLTSSCNLAELAPKLENAMAIDSLLDSHDSACCPGPNLATAPDFPAYILFTSGSTGQPKGVIMSHAAVCSQTPEYARSTGMTSDSRTLQFSSYSFDVSIQEIFGTLFVGGCICIPSEASRLDDLPGAIRSLEVNWAMLMASVAELLEPSTVPCLKTFVIGGETMSQGLIDRWLGRVELYTTYGPTEACVTCVARRIEPSRRTANIIGTPVGCRAWVVNSFTGLLVPVGAVGELWLEGPLLASGYLNNGSKTAEAFVTLPDWGLESGPRLHASRAYRTGDIVKYTEDGEIQFIGRADNQLKIRGHRIELDEIAHRVANLATDGQRLAVDVVKFLGSDQSMIVVFAAQSQNARPNEKATPLLNDDGRQQAETLRKQLSPLLDQLPSYMVPSIYLPVEFLPVTSNGKIDRTELRNAVSMLRHEQVVGLLGEAGFVEQPFTNRQTILRTLLAEILQLAPEMISVSRNIFTLGADSITAVKLVKAAADHDVKLTVADIFKTPTIRDLAEISHDESDEWLVLKPFSLLGLSRATSADIQDRLHLGAIELDDAYPCTPFQEGLMALSLKEPGSFTNQQVYRLPKSLDMARFQIAVDQALGTGQIFRTSILASENSSMVQCVLSEPTLTTQAHSLQDYLLRDSDRQMSFGERLCRSATISEAHGNFWVLTLHHAIYDGYTMDTLLKSVRLAYQGSELHSCVSFNSFVQKVMASSSERSSDWWTAYLGANVDFEHFPEQQHHITTPTLPHKRMSKIIGGKFADDCSFTRPSILRAAWALTQHVYTGAQNVVFGVVSSGRNALGHPISTVPGPTLAVMPFLARISPASSVHSFLSDLERSSADMMSHEQLGLQRIAELSETARVASHFGTLIVIQNQTNSQDDRHQDWIVPIELDDQANSFSSCPLDLECVLLHEAFRINLSYDPSILSLDQVSRLVTQLELMCSRLSAALAGEATTLEEVCGLSPILVQEIDFISRSTGPERSAECVHTLFEQQALKQPTSPAVSSHEGTMSYEQLDSRSRKLAVMLRCRYGVVEGQVVPLCFERSSWAVVSMLAILKAGAAYTSVDPAYPSSRLAAIMDSTKAKLILSSQKHSAAMLGLLTRVVVPETEITQACETRQINWDNPKPSGLAIVNFTSGSTGAPKGILLSHAAISSSILSHGRSMGLGPSARVLAFAAFTFDVSNSDVFATLAHGGCICMPSEEERMNNLAHAICKLGATHACLTSSVASTLQPEDVPSLRTLTLGGEPLAKAELVRWAPRVHLINIYGPAECAIWCMANPGLHKDADPSNVGRAINSRAWVVHPDRPNMLQPIGVAGELAISGPLLADGYLNLAERTASVFLEKPFWMRDLDCGPFTRIYRTGDMARLNEDGTICLLGRRDSQIKLRGQRIELGDIHFHLQELFSGHELAVDVVISKASEAGSIVGFICVPPSSQDGGHEYLCTDEESLSWLQRKIDCSTPSLRRDLPSYMIPSGYLAIRKLPLSTSGKLDRVKLLGIALENLHLIKYPMAIIGNEPESKSLSEEEEVLQEIWSDILSLNRSVIGVTADFFALSGDSIKAMRVAATARRRGIVVTVADHFKLRTIAGVARASRRISVTAVDAPVATQQSHIGIDQLTTDFSDLSEADVETIVPALEFQSLSAALSLGPGRDFLNFFVLQWSDCVEEDRMRMACQELVRRFSILRTCFGFHGCQMQQIVLKKLEIDFGVLQSESFSSSTLANIVENDKQRVEGLLQLRPRFVLVQSQRCSWLVLRLSHAHYDGVSLPVIWRTIHAAYSGLTIPYLTHDFAAFSRKLVNSDNEQAYNHWRSLLDGATMTEVSDKSLPRYDASANTVLSRTILLPIHPDPSITFATVLKSAWGIVLSCWTGSSDVVFGHLVAGRHHGMADVDNIVGPCINIIPIRLSLDSCCTTGDVLSALKQQQIDGLPHEHIGFKEIVQNCTQWPAWTRLSTMVQHQSHEAGSDSEIRNNEPYSQSEHMSIPPVLVHDICIITVPSGDAVEVSMSFTKSLLSDQAANVLLDQLCRAMRLICTLPPVDSALNVYSGAQSLKLNRSTPKHHSELLPLAPISSHVTEAILESWSRALGTHAPPGTLNLDEPLCADPTFAAHVMLLYKERGLRVSFEDLLSHPTAREQIWLLVN